jgi:hypothetical protein
MTMGSENKKCFLKLPDFRDDAQQTKNGIKTSLKAF